MGVSSDDLVSETAQVCCIDPGSETAQVCC